MTRSTALCIFLLGAACAVVFGRAHPFGDPRSEEPQGKRSLLANADMPLESKVVLLSKCADCHSAETHFPAYARLAPGSWLIERDIIEGRRHLDLSHWGDISEDQRDVLKAEIVEQAKKRHMPPPQYRLVHWGAGLSPREVQALSLLRQSAKPLTATETQVGDPVHGKLMFEKRCTGCHALNEDREGPHLQGVFGRRAASAPSFRYSDALKNARLVWDEPTLERWLADPDSLVPNNAMGVDLPKAVDRRDVIAFLRQQQP